MFRCNVRRSGSLRSIWHQRERKRKPLAAPTVVATATPPRLSFRWNVSAIDWFCGNPHSMLNCLGRIANEPRFVFYLTPAQADRKIRLFYCAVCRLRWNDLPNDDIRHAVEVIEDHADGRHNRAEWGRVRRLILEAEHDARRATQYAVNYPASRAVVDLVNVVVWASQCGRALHNRAMPSEVVANSATAARLLYEIFRNPFAPTAIDPRWLTRTVVGVARAIHEASSFELMDVLGDALQDAGCDSHVILNHCYEHRSHSRGCWLIDALTGNG